MERYDTADFEDGLGRKMKRGNTADSYDYGDEEYWEEEEEEWYGEEEEEGGEEGEQQQSEGKQEDKQEPVEDSKDKAGDGAPLQKNSSSTAAGDTIAWKDETEEAAKAKRARAAEQKLRLEEKFERDIAEQGQLAMMRRDLAAMGLMVDSLDAAALSQLHSRMTNSAAVVEQEFEEIIAGDDDIAKRLSSLDTLRRERVVTVDREFEITVPLGYPDDIPSVSATRRRYNFEAFWVSSHVIDRDTPKLLTALCKFFLECEIPISKTLKRLAAEGFDNEFQSSFTNNGGSGTFTKSSSLLGGLGAREGSSGGGSTTASTTGGPDSFEDFEKSEILAARWVEATGLKLSEHTIRSLFVETSNFDEMGPRSPTTGTEAGGGSSPAPRGVRFNIPEPVAEKRGAFSGGHNTSAAASSQRMTTTGKTSGTRVVRRADLVSNYKETSSGRKTSSTTTAGGATNDDYSSSGRHIVVVPSELDSPAVKAAANKARLIDRMTSVKDNQLTMLIAADLPLLPPAVPTNIQTLETLTHLDLSNNKLKSLPPLGKMKLQKIYLRQNDFEDFPDSLFESSSIADTLKILDLSFNALREIPFRFCSFKSMEELDLSHNRISKIHDNFFNIAKTLKIFDVTNNSLTSLPAALAQCEKLWRLKMSANPMYQVPPDVYYRGVDAVKLFLNETRSSTTTTRGTTISAAISPPTGGPTSSVLPSSSFQKDMVWLWSNYDADKDVELVCPVVRRKKKNKKNKVGGGARKNNATTNDSNDGDEVASARIHMVSLAARAPALAILVMNIRLEEQQKLSEDEDQDDDDGIRSHEAAGNPKKVTTLRLPYGCHVSSPDVLTTLARFICTGESYLLDKERSSKNTNSGNSIASSGSSSSSFSSPMLKELQSLASQLGLFKIEEELNLIADKTLYDEDEAVANCYEAAMPANESAGDVMFVVRIQAQEGGGGGEEGDGDGVNEFVEKKFYGHKHLLCARNPFLNSIFSSSVNTSRGEAPPSSNVVVIDDGSTHPDVFEAFWTFLYSDSLHGGAEKKKLSVHNSVNLLFFSEHYQCPRLQAMAESAVGYFLDEENVAQILQVAFYLDLTRLKKSCMYYAAAHYSAVVKTAGWAELEESPIQELKQCMQDWGISF